ncbi:MAG: SEC-C domain-containing protein [Chloroflexi bacterium]|nr:SEC-C domain-containing protein [Chloroflexota bacterium]
MPSIGRNDPCPCGSGRKYKNCCLIHDRIAEQRDLNLPTSQGRVLSFLYAFARQPKFNQDILEGFNLYWGAAFEPAVANEVGPENMRRFFEWFVNDYPTRPDKRYIIDLFNEKGAGKIAEEDQALLDAWQKSTMGLFRILGKLEGEDMLLFDALRESELTVRDGVFARAAATGDVLLGRLYELNGTRHLSHMTMALPAPYETELVVFITNAYRTYGSEQGEDSSWDQFLRSYSSLFNAFLISERSNSLRHLIGPGTPYADPALGRDKLTTAMARLREEKQKAATAEKQEIAGGRRTASGIILPGSAKPEPTNVVKPGGEQPAKSSSILVPGRDL